MRMVDVIQNKRDGYELTKEEIQFLINGFTKGDIPDYQMSVLIGSGYNNLECLHKLEDTAMKYKAVCNHYFNFYRL